MGSARLVVAGGRNLPGRCPAIGVFAVYQSRLTYLPYELLQYEPSIKHSRQKLQNLYTLCYPVGFLSGSSSSCIPVSSAYLFALLNEVGRRGLLDALYSVQMHSFSVYALRVTAMLLTAFHSDWHLSFPDFFRTSLKPIITDWRGH